MKKQLIDNEFGEITVLFQRNFKNLTIRLSATSGIQISAPASASKKQVLLFFESRRDWIRKNMENIKSITSNKTLFTPETTFFTKKHALHLRKETVSEMQFKIANEKIHVIVPDAIEWENEATQKYIRKAITEALRIEAQQYLPRRLFELATKFGFEVKGLKIKNLKSRWGSCTSALSLNLNLNLMQLPNHLIDHVILHELCHTRFMNHGAGFHNLLQEVDPLAKLNEKEIRKYNPNLY